VIIRSSSLHIFLSLETRKRKMKMKTPTVKIVFWASVAAPVLITLRCAHTLSGGTGHQVCSVV